MGVVCFVAQREAVGLLRIACLVGGLPAGSIDVLHVPGEVVEAHAPVWSAVERGALISIGTDQNFPKLSDKAKDNTGGIEKLFGKPMSVADLHAIPADEWIQKKIGPDGKSIYDAVHSVVGQYVIDNSVFTGESVNLRRNGVLNGIDIHRQLSHSPGRRQIPRCCHAPIAGP
jgi:para-nitrobenzyl esterase